MKNVVINKKELIEIVSNFLVKHTEEYDEIMAGYRKQVKQLLLAAITAVESDSLTSLAIKPPPPNFKLDYEVSIKMIERDKHSQIELTEEEFRKLVINDWPWKTSFDASKSLYITD